MWTEDRNLSSLKLEIVLVQANASSTLAHFACLICSICWRFLCSTYMNSLSCYGSFLPQGWHVWNCSMNFEVWESHRLGWACLCFRYLTSASSSDFHPCLWIPLDHSVYLHHWDHILRMSWTLPSISFLLVAPFFWFVQALGTLPVHLWSACP